MVQYGSSWGYDALVEYRKSGSRVKSPVEAEVEGREQ
jgi:hypothetical protein